MIVGAHRRMNSILLWIVNMAVSEKGKPGNLLLFSSSPAPGLPISFSSVFLG